jgi:hypothetical protein
MPSENKIRKADKKPAMHWVDARKLSMEGQGWKKTAGPYDRFPARAKSSVPDPVWILSRNSAWIAVRFVSSASEIHCRWKLTSATLAMNHMPATGVSGVDLYVRLSRGDKNQRWHWTGIGRPAAQINEVKIAAGIPPGKHEFLLYLPLYNGVKSVEIGVPRKAKIVPAPARPAGKARQVLFYGTSITQGGCASRPGMAYSAIIGRILDRPAINFGFSGSGRMDPPVVDLLCEIDPAVYVIDCCPNLSPELIAERTEPLVRKLRQAHPKTPIILVENIEYQAGAFLPEARRDYTGKNVALCAAYKRLLTAGIKGLYYVPGKQLFGQDGDATVDGVHATDLGFIRIAECLAPVIKKAIRAKVPVLLP